MDCLKYCRRRFMIHPGSGIHKVIDDGDFSLGQCLIITWEKGKEKLCKQVNVIFADELNILIKMVYAVDVA